MGNMTKIPDGVAMKCQRNIYNKLSNNTFIAIIKFHKIRKGSKHDDILGVLNAQDHKKE